MRRKYLSFAIALLLSVTVWGQDIKIFTHNIDGSNGQEITNSTLTVNSNYIDEVSLRFHIMNNTSSSLNISISKQIINQIDGSSNVFCWAGACTDTIVLDSPTIQSINAGLTNTGFYSYYRPWEHMGKTYIKYTFKDHAKTAYVIVIFNASTTSHIKLFSKYLDGSSGSEITNKTITVNGANNAELSYKLNIENNTLNPITVSAEKLIVNSVTGSVNEFYWGTSYADTNAINAPISQTIALNNSVLFDARYRAYGHTGSTKIKFTFKSNTDTSYVTLIFDAVSGINDISNYSEFISVPKPNPANTFTSISFYVKYSKNAYLSVYNMLGQEVKHLDAVTKTGSIKVYTSDLNPGVYFCSFVADGKVVKTSKLIVNR